MEELTFLKELPSLIAIIVVFGFVFYRIIKLVIEKYIASMEQFRRVVENHLEHDYQSREAEIKSRIKLAEALDRLGVKIENNNFK